MTDATAEQAIVLAYARLKGLRATATRPALGFAFVVEVAIRDSGSPFSVSVARRDFRDQGRARRPGRRASQQGAHV
jgi:hypothetical protein